MYKCLECGHLFEEGEQKKRKENRGEYWGSPCYEEMSGCPLCNGAYEETTACKICGGHFFADELHGKRVCNDCLNEYKRNFDICYKIADTEKETVKINALLTSLLSVNKIEAILYNYLKDKENDCSAFVEQDKDWFADKLVREVVN